MVRLEQSQREQPGRQTNARQQAEWEQVVRVTPWADLVFGAVPEHRDDEAVVFPDQRLTFGEFAERIVRRGRSLLALGVRRGDHIGLLMPNSVEFLELLYAGAAIGAVTVVLNVRFRTHELRYAVGNADLRLLFTVGATSAEHDYCARLITAFPSLAGQASSSRLQLDEAPRLEQIILLDGETSSAAFVPPARFDALADEVDALEVHRRRQLVRVRDPFLMLYTSGTTSTPKGCLQTHEAVVRNVHWVGERYGIVAGDRFWSALPLSHLTSIFVCGAMMSRGGTFVCMPYFEPGAALQMLEQERATIAILAFPAIINDLLDHSDKPQRDLTRIRVVMSNAAVQPKAVQQRLRDAFPTAYQIGTYAMTETAAAGACTAVYDEGEGVGFRSLGRTMPGMDIRVVDEAGRDVPTGKRGEIWVTGFGLFEGYYGEPKRTDEVLHDGWIHSGDLGSIDERGEIMYHGRIKDMLRVGGENVAASEIEEYLHQHPAVRICQVVGAPDERLSEVPAAFIELVDGASLTEQEVIEFCRGHISGYKVPRYIRFVSEWPVTASSKIQKRVLADALAAELASVGSV